MDKIMVSGMLFYGYHGVFPEETKLGQRFKVDIEVETPLKEAGTTDDLTKSVHYGELYQICREVVEGKPFKLVEAVAESLAKTILERYVTIDAVTVKVIKPDPPIPGYYDSVAIVVRRTRDDYQ